LKVSDINFQTNEVLIPRRADDPADLRAQQPRTKTNDRLLALDEDLAELTRRYVMKNRRAIKGARKHEFLWVANGSGAPLSLSGFHKIFITLRERVPDLPKSLSAHVMRHMERCVSAEMDLAGVSEAEEHKMRTRLMGWSDTSSMASVYTRRHIRKKAKDASLACKLNCAWREEQWHLILLS
jgi:site-specific recombinase XerD